MENWTPTGTVNLKRYELKDGIKRQLYDSLKKNNIDREKVNSFISALEKSISEYHAMLEITSRCKPADIRKNLKAVLTQIDKTREKLNALDHNSRILVNNLSKGGMKGVFDGLFDLQIVINNAYIAAQSYPKRGQLVTYYKYTLVDSIANAIQSFLKVKPTSTKDGLLEACAAIVLSDITGKSADGIHTLIEKVIKSRK